MNYNVGLGGCVDAVAGFTCRSWIFCFFFCETRYRFFWFLLQVVFIGELKVGWMDLAMLVVVDPSSN